MFWKKSKSIKDIIANNLDIPVQAEDKRYSALFSMSGQPGKASENLLSSALGYAAGALAIDLSDIAARVKKGPDYINIYPGEHYKLLASIINIRKPQVVVELGTHLGYSALCMKKFMPAGGRIHTFDIIAWNQFADTIFTEKDFDDALAQHTDDLTKWEDVQKHKMLLESADIVFMDALKDGKQEYQFLDNFSRLSFKKNCLFIFDDIRLWNMLDIWYNLDKPKLDMTSFGHWSGTGLVEWS
ncbi:MAG: class I SAM-dependent methyltransferase [Chitinophagaceae bacterium]|nr:class I SAM-dependent methyltransferase [Chitinophagaceae bacterium]